MASLNKVIIIGNLGADPEVRYTTSGDQITSIRVATSENWKDRNTGERQERTEWHRVSFFRKLAEIAGQYLKKGSQVYVEGSLRTSKYTGKDGIERYTTDIVATELKMLGSRQGSGDPDGSFDNGYQGGGNSGYQQRSSAPRQGGRTQPPHQPQGGNVPNIVMDDDIPF